MKSLCKSILLLAVVFSATPLFARMPGPFPGEERWKLQEEAVSLAVIHYLDLAPEQRSQMKEILAPVRKDGDEARSRGEKWNKKVMEPRLRKVISDLKKGRKPEPPSEDLVAESETFHQQMRDYRITAKATVEKVLNVLTPEQRERLRTFQPHEYIGLTPPPPRPMRGALLEVIDEIREIPQEEFDKLVAHLESRGTTGRKKGPAGTNRAQTLVAFMTEVRNMPEEEFKAQHERLEEQYEQLRPPQGPEPGIHMRREGRQLDGPGPKKGMRGKGPKAMGGKEHHGKGPMKKDILKRVLLSEEFYKAL